MTSTSVKRAKQQQSLRKEPPANKSAGGHNPAFIWKVTFIAALSGILFGYDAASINAAQESIEAQFGIAGFTFGCVVASLLLGAALGAIYGGHLADRIGRKITIMLSGVLFIVGLSVASFAPSLVVLILGRLIIGAAIGITSGVTPAYIAEVAPAEKRGSMVTLFQLAITIGIMFAFFIGMIFHSSGNWHMMMFLAVIPAAVQIVCMFMVPETPRYLLTKGRKDEARKVLQHIRGHNNVDAELKDISAVMWTEKSGTWKDLFSQRARPAMVAGVGLIMIQAFCGINAIMYFSNSVFKIAGVGSASLATFIVGAVNVAATVVALKIVNKYGRKPILYAGLSTMVASLLIGGIALQFSSPITGMLVVITTLTFVIGFAFSIGPIAWLIVSEVFPLSIRGRAAAFATGSNWGSNFVIAMLFPGLVGQNPTRVGISFLIFGAVSFFGIFFVKSKVPETKDRSLEDIERELSALSEDAEIEHAKAA